VASVSEGSVLREIFGSKALSRNTFRIRGQQSGMLDTITAVDTSPTYQLR